MMRQDKDPALDPQRLREQIQKLQTSVKALEEADIVVDGVRLLKVRAPNGHYYSLGVSNVGAMVLTDQGTKL